MEGSTRRADLWSLEDVVCGAAETVRTSGLRWNLTGGGLEMGRLISTSNALDVVGTDGEVRIETDAPLLWTTDVSRMWSVEESPARLD